MKTSENIISHCVIGFVIIILQRAIFVSSLPQSPTELLQNNQHEKITITLNKEKRDASTTTQPFHMTAFGVDYKANLERTTETIFSSTFKYNILEENSAGKLVLKDVTPSPKEIKLIEDEHLIDRRAGAALSLRDSNNGTQQVRGVIGNIAIAPHPTSDDHKATKINREPPPTAAFFADFIDLHRNITPINISTRAMVIAQPEIYVIFDHTNYNTFKGDTNAIIDYLAVFFHGVNNRFATIADPKISFKISGITAIASAAAQPFIENHKTPDGTGNDINKVLDSFSSWVYANRNTIPKHDMAAIISGRDMQIPDSKGKYEKSVSGIAYLTAACWVDNRRQRSLAVSVSEDFGGIYDGIYTVAHEFAHNLAAPHDGTGGASGCSWNDGNLMSYMGWGTKNKFLFSQCSVTLMKNFIQSSGATCLKTIENPNGVAVSSDNPGDRISMTDLCKRYTKQTAAVVDSSRKPSDLCKNLVCKYPTPGRPAGWTSTMTMNRPPGDNSACGSGGKCVNGECVGGTG